MKFRKHGPVHSGGRSSLEYHAMATTLGCVSFLNARPLIDGLDNHPDLRVSYDVPSALLEDLLTGQVDLALCPVVDYQLADEPLQVVPVGGIGCDGPTLTVRLYSRVPIEQIRRIRSDADSHTSNVLMRVVLADLYGIRPEAAAASTPADDPSLDALLLIGDKVVTAAPSQERYPHELDLGEAWKSLTGLPFVFAVWMCRQNAELGTAPAILDEQRRINRGRIDEIVDAAAPRSRWPRDLARQYLGRFLRYNIGPRQLEAMQRFWQRAYDLGFLSTLRPLVLHGASAEPVT